MSASVSPSLVFPPMVRDSAWEAERRRDKEWRVQQALALALATARCTDHTDILEHVAQQFDALTISRVSLVSAAESRAEYWANDRLVAERASGAYRNELEELFAELLASVMAEFVSLLAKRLPLSPADSAQADYLLTQCPPATVVADAFNVRLTGKELRCLRPREWLNDEAINMFLQLLQQRSNSAGGPGSRKRCYFFNTFFFAKLLDGGSYSHKNVARWTRRVDIFSYDLILLPVHVHGNHWCLGVLDLQHRRLEYYDSLGGENPLFFDTMRRYLRDECTAKQGATAASALQVDSWPGVLVRCPRQDNGSDCGVFALKFADYLSDGAPCHFTAKDMNYFRQRIALEIKYQRIL